MTEVQAPEETGAAPQGAPHAEGRRTQFRIVRESIQNLSIEVGRYRKSHEVSAKKLEAQVASLRKDLATHIRSKDLGEHVKSHETGSRRLEQQVTSLRKELASLRSQMAKEAAKSRAREEAALSKLVAKAKAARPAKKAKASKKKR
jgi:septal ring factor EnvC (AmiA/AmiB activator)